MQSEKYRNRSFYRFKVGSGLELICSLGQPGRRILPSDVVDWLSACRIFRTLEEHERVIAESLVPERLPELRRRLREFVQSGLLVSCEGLLTLAQGEVSKRQPNVSTIGIITRSRLRALTRCIRSYAENLKRHGRTGVFAVFDDSPDSAERRSCRQIAAKLQSELGLDILYAGFEEKRRFTDLLTKRQAAPREVIEFAVLDSHNCGYSTGANRNALLLHTAGEMTLQSDDDVVCSVGSHPERAGNITFSSDADPTELWFYGTREAARGDVTPSDQDLLSIHEILLGKPIVCVI